MPKKKKESLLEKTEEVLDKIIEKTKEEIRNVEEVFSKEDSEKKTKEDRLTKLKEKAKALESSLEDVKDIDLKKKVKEEEEKKETIVPMEEYLKSSIHLGTRVITPNMKKYVYRRRADGLAVFNTALLDNLLLEGAEYLAKFPPEQVVVVCKREAGWKAVKKFSEITEIKNFTKKYPAGILTNTQLENFAEFELVLICDPWIDKNALTDANRIKIPVLSICDTNNYTNGITKIIPGNNKSAKSLGMIFYILSKIYYERKKLKTEEPKIQDFVDNWDNLQPPK